MAADDIAVRWVNDAPRLDIVSQVTLAGAVSSADTLTFQRDPRCSDPEETNRDSTIATSA